MAMVNGIASGGPRETVIQMCPSSPLLRIVEVIRAMNPQLEDHTCSISYWDRITFFLKTTNGESSTFLHNLFFIFWNLCFLVEIWDLLHKSTIVITSQTYTHVHNYVDVMVAQMPLEWCTGKLSHKAQWRHIVSHATILFRLPDFI